MSSASQPPGSPDTLPVGDDSGPPALPPSGGRVAPGLLSFPGEALAMIPPGRISLDDSLWPLLMVKFTGMPATAQVAAYLEQLTGYLERGERHVTLVDTSGMTGAGPSEQRQLQVEWMKRHEARLNEQLLGSAYVITSPLVRLSVSVIFFLKPMRQPYVITSTVPEAAAWTANLLQQAGCALPARRVREHFSLPGGERSEP
jgi:hypothetical protein